MTNYSENPGMTRFDFFKESGKWYMTMALDMSPHWNRGIIPHDAVEATLRDAGRWPLSMDVVVLEPYHKSAYPVMLRAER